MAHVGTWLLIELQVFFVGEVGTIGADLIPEDDFALAQESARSNWTGSTAHSCTDICRHLSADVIHCGGQASADQVESYRRAGSSSEADDGALFERFLCNSTTGSMHRRVAFVDSGYIQASAPPPSDAAEGNNRVFRAIQVMAAGRRGFSCTSGSPGIGPPEIEPGDQICVVSGVPTPLIPRRVGARACENNTSVYRLVRTAGTRAEITGVCNATHDKCYWLVGDAYVAGMMDGEGLKRRGLFKRRVSGTTVYLV
jgi:hypothetical protein